MKPEITIEQAVEILQPYVLDHQLRQGRPMGARNKISTPLKWSFRRVAPVHLDRLYRCADSHSAKVAARCLQWTQRDIFKLIWDNPTVSESFNQWMQARTEVVKGMRYDVLKHTFLNAYRDATSVSGGGGGKRSHMGRRRGTNVSFERYLHYVANQDAVVFAKMFMKVFRIPGVRMRTPWLTMEMWQALSGHDDGTPEFKALADNLWSLFNPVFVQWRSKLPPMKRVMQECLRDGAFEEALGYDG